MPQRKLPIFVLIIAILTACGPHNKAHEETSSADSVADSIAAALDYQITHYPTAQYRDVYKNFMQDYFGPGHILADTAASARYLRAELAQTDSFAGPLYEPTGYKGNFYRVNLSVLRDNLVPYDVFFNAFVESVQGITPPDGDTWMHTWATIDSVITARNITFPNEAADRQALAEQFAQGNYIAHHSPRFNQTVNFHYRIISRPLFQTRIRPYLE